MSLKEPIEFESMEGGDSVPVSIIIMLALQDSASQLETLQNVVGIFQSEETMKKIYETNDKEVLADLLSQAGIV